MRAASFALALLALAAGPSAARPPGVRCAGGETLAPLVRAWAADVAAAKVSVDADARLAADGFRALLEGRADCVMFVREPFPSERAAFRARFGHDPLLIPVARGSFATRGGTHAIAIYVNAANPLAGLTLDQVEAVLSARPRGRPAPAQTWGDLGLTGAWVTLEMGARKTASVATMRTPATVATTATRGPRRLGTAKKTMAPISASPPMTASKIAIRSPIVVSLFNARRSAGRSARRPARRRSG